MENVEKVPPYLMFVKAIPWGAWSYTNDVVQFKGLLKKKVTGKYVGFQVQCGKRSGIAQTTVHVTAMT